MAAGGQPTGVAVAVRADTQQEMLSFGASMSAASRAVIGLPLEDDRGKPDPALEALYTAILKSLGEAPAHIGGPDVFNAPPKGTFRIIVGPKP